jgi:hypothetical protein
MVIVKKSCQDMHLSNLLQGSSIPVGTWGQGDMNVSTREEDDVSYSTPGRLIPSIYLIRYRGKGHVRRVGTAGAVGGHYRTVTCLPR